jgi:hypothetical protein
VRAFGALADLIHLRYGRLEGFHEPKRARISKFQNWSTDFGSSGISLDESFASFGYYRPIAQLLN